LPGTGVGKKFSKASKGDNIELSEVHEYRRKVMVVTIEQDDGLRDSEEVLTIDRNFGVPGSVRNGIGDYGSDAGRGKLRGHQKSFDVGFSEDIEVRRFGPGQIDKSNLVAMDRASAP
jgi:hypothetical protein